MNRLLPILILVAAAARGESDESRVTFLYPADSTSPPVVSMTQRFVFRGFDRRDGTRLSAWTEDIASRLEQRMQRRIPFGRFDVIRIEGVEQFGRTGGEVLVGQGVANGSLQQRVVVANPDHIESEALLEGMVHVLLNRMVVADYFAEGGLPEGALIPDWLSVGMAQGLRGDLRQRNKSFVLKHWGGEEAPNAVEVLAMATLPPGRDPQKAFCGVLLEWLESVGGGAALWPVLLHGVVTEDAVDASWMAREILGMKTERDLNQAWDVWLADAAGSRKILGQLGFKEVAALKSLLDIRLVDYGLSPVADLPARFEPGDLIEYKNENWARTVALQLLGKLREARVGQAPDLVAVVDQYASFFSGFNLGERGSMSATRLSELLDEAERGMTLLEKSVALQAHYMNNVENQQVSAESEDDFTPPRIEEKRRSFLDQIEHQRSGEGQP